MNSRFRLIFIGTVIVLAGLLIYFQEFLLTQGINRLLKKNTEGIFSEPAQFDSIRLDRFLQLHARGFSGRLMTRQNPALVQIGRIDCEGPIFDVLFERSLVCRAAPIYLSDSLQQKTEAELVFQAGRSQEFLMTVRTEALDLSDVAWLDPGHLTGSTGLMKGVLNLRAGARIPPFFSLSFQVAEPGGRMQAELFDLLRPFLPINTQKTLLNKDTAGKRLMRYTRASLKLRTLQADKIGGTFRILLPDDSADLNVNLEIHVDRENAFWELAELLGQFEVRT